MPFILAMTLKTSINCSKCYSCLWLGLLESFPHTLLLLLLLLLWPPWLEGVAAPLSPEFSLMQWIASNTL